MSPLLWKGGYYMPIWDNGIEVGQKWFGCPKCKDGRTTDYL